MRFAAKFMVALLVGLGGSAFNEARAELATHVETELVCQNWLTFVSHQQGDWAGVGDPEVVDVEDIIEDGTVLARCFHIAPRGHVVVPMLKELSPVQLYSDECTLDVNEPGGTSLLLRQFLAHQNRLFVETYGNLKARQPRADDALFDLRNREEWDRYLVEPGEFKADLDGRRARSLTQVGPLLTTEWHQGHPYNLFCPLGYGGRTAVGCVATAMAQIMRYHGGPEAGMGSKTYYWDGDDSCPGHTTTGRDLTAYFDDPYDWGHVPDDCTGGCSGTEQNALAELSYEVAVAFEMDFGYCGSGASIAEALTAMPTYFRYDAAIRREQRLYHTEANWFALIQTEINAGRPMLYAFSWVGGGGHAIVCDGWADWDAEKWIHINYGWGGQYTGWWRLDEIPNSEDPLEEDMICDIKLTADCNGNGVSDPRDIMDGTSEDCNDDGRPDECGVIDECQITKLTHPDAPYMFGNSVSICPDDSELAIIGAPDEDAYAGAAHVYRRAGTTWVEEQALAAADAVAGDQFGYSVAINGDVAVVGAWLADGAAGESCGAAYVFRFNGETWIQEQKLTAADAAAQDRFGSSVAVHGDVIVVGAPVAECGAGADCGAAYVYRYNGGSWDPDPSPGPNGKLFASDADDHDEFGVTLTVSGDDIMIGAWKEECHGGVGECGAVYAYHYGSGSWIEDQKIEGSDGRFGYPVVIDGDWAIVGAPFAECSDGPMCGEAFIYHHEVGGWVEVAHFTASEPTSGDTYGRSASIHGTIAVVGAPGEDCGAGASCGALYAYHFDGNVWYPEGKLNADDAAVGGQVGTSASLSGDVVLMGAAGGAVYSFAVHGDDCNCDASADLCDIARLTSEDCQPNGIPDDCELDCQPNGVPDDCDIAAGTSADINENSVPDECEVVVEALPAPYPDNRRRNRYIQFDSNPENAGTDVAFKVTLTSLALGSCDDGGSPDVAGWACRTDNDCRACSVSEDPCWTAPLHCPAGESCNLTGASCVNDQAGSVGTSWWVGFEHPTTGVHLMVTQPYRKVSNAWPAVVLVGDCEIVPAAIYEVRAVEVSTELETDPLEVKSAEKPDKFWADCAGPLGDYCTGNWRACASDADCEVCYNWNADPKGDPNNASSLTPCTSDDDCPAPGEFCGTTCVEQWPPPDGFINFHDINAAVFTFSGLPTVTSTDLPNVDLHGDADGDANVNPPNYIVNFNDIGLLVKAFEGWPYPYSDPGNCPDVAGWPP